MIARVDCTVCAEETHRLDAKEIVLVKDRASGYYFITFNCPNTGIRESVVNRNLSYGIVHELVAAGAERRTMKRLKLSRIKDRNAAPITEADVEEFCHFMKNHKFLAAYA